MDKTEFLSQFSIPVLMLMIKDLEFQQSEQDNPALTDWIILAKTVLAEKTDDREEVTNDAN